MKRSLAAIVFVFYVAVSFNVQSQQEQEQENSAAGEPKAKAEATPAGGAASSDEALHEEGEVLLLGLEKSLHDDLLCPSSLTRPTALD